MPARARADLAMSQERVKVLRPTGSNWNEQPSGSATTVTGARGDGITERRVRVMRERLEQREVRECRDQAARR